MSLALLWNPRPRSSRVARRLNICRVLNSSWRIPRVPSGWTELKLRSCLSTCRSRCVTPLVSIWLCCFVPSCLASSSADAVLHSWVLCRTWSDFSKWESLIVSAFRSTVSLSTSNPKDLFFPKLLVNTFILIDSLYKVSHVPFKLYLHNVHLRATRFCYNRESHNKPIVLILMFYLFSKCHYNALFAPPPKKVSCDLRIISNTTNINQTHAGV